MVIQENRLNLRKRILNYLEVRFKHQCNLFSNSSGRGAGVMFKSIWNQCHLQCLLNLGQCWLGNNLNTKEFLIFYYRVNAIPIFFLKKKSSAGHLINNEKLILINSKVLGRWDGPVGKGTWPEPLKLGTQAKLPYLFLSGILQQWREVNCYLGGLLTKIFKLFFTWFQPRETPGDAEDSSHEEMSKAFPSPTSVWCVLGATTTH